MRKRSNQISEFAFAVAQHWWALAMGIVAIVGTLLDLASSTGASETRISIWIWMAIIGFPLLAACYLAFKDVSKQRNSIKDELAVFRDSANQAINGATIATSLVLALNVVAAKLDGGTQLLSLGQIQGFQQLVQNIIWATGLADLGGLSFRPQIAASFQPLLERFYHQIAQAEIPGPGDLIRFQLREVYLPDRREVLLAGENIDAFVEGKPAYKQET